MIIKITIGEAEEALNKFIYKRKKLFRVLLLYY